MPARRSQSALRIVSHPDAVWKLDRTLTCASANKAVRFIQVRWNLKVADLIRRCRAEAKLSPVQSRNPYIEVDGKRLGHGEMLGEEGRKTDMENLPTVRFFFDVAQEESEAESL